MVISAGSTPVAPAVMTISTSSRSINRETIDWTLS